MADDTIFRVVKDRENPYAMTHKALIRDQRLAWDTRGLLIFLLSMPDDWEVRMKHLKSAGPAKRTALRRMIKDAVTHGYMVRRRENGGRHGKFQWVTLVYEAPELNPYLTTANDPSAGFQPMVPSVGYPPVGDPPTGDPPTGDPPTGDPPTENLPIYRILIVRSTDWTENGDGDGKREEQNSDDDGISFSDDWGLSSEKKRRSVVVPRVPSLVAAWCAAMITEWLPEWDGGERFPETLDDGQVHALATWLWAAKHFGFATPEDRHGVDWPRVCYLFMQSSGRPFDGVENPIGKIVTQARLGNDLALHNDDMDCLVDAIASFADPALALFGDGDGDEDDAGVPW